MYDDQSPRESGPKATTPQRIGVGAGAVLVLLATAAVAHDSASSTSPPDASSEPVPVAVPAEKSAVKGPRPSPSLTETAVLPDLVGQPLRAARTAAANAGFSDLTSRDATDRQRVQIGDGHWKVCAQNPLPGTHSTLTEVEFTAVPTHEPCPD